METNRGERAGVGVQETAESVVVHGGLHGYLPRGFHHNSQLYVVM